MTKPLVSRLRAIRTVLKSGEYNGADLMEAWCAASDAADEIERMRASFKNFHRLLCERFGYGHDDVDWERDQLSLIEWIAKRAASEPSACNCGCKVPDGHHWQCPQYKPAVKSDAGLQCTFCDGTGMVDSGGVQPWGEAIFVACPECSPSRTNLQHSGE